MDAYIIRAYSMKNGIIAIGSYNGCQEFDINIIKKQNNLLYKDIELADPIGKIEELSSKELMIIAYES